MKLPVAPIQRIVLGVAAAALVAGSLSVVALAIQPASSDSGAAQTELTLVEPASDEPTATTTEPVTLVTMAAEVLGVPERAENAAVRAEVAADRAEVAAVHVDQVAGHVDEVVATTTTTMPATTTTTVGKPSPGALTPPPTSSTTTTTVAPAYRVSMVSAVWPATQIGADQYNTFYGGNISIRVELQHVAGGESTVTARQFHYKLYGGGKVVGGGSGMGPGPWTISADDPLQSVDVELFTGAQTEHGTGWLWVYMDEQFLGRINCMPTGTCQIAY